MNKTVIYITFVALAALALIGTVLLLMYRPDASATFTAFVIQILGIATVAAGTFYGFGRTNEKLERVERQTNGALHRRDLEIERLTLENIDLAKQIPPTTGEIQTH